MPVIIHGLDLSPPCRAVMLTGRAIGIDIVLKDVDMFVNQEHKSESFRKVRNASY